MIQYASSYSIVDPAVDISTNVSQKFSGNFGLGFRWIIGKFMSFDVEGMAYATDIDKPVKIINSHITAGIRLFIG